MWTIFHVVTGEGEATVFLWNVAMLKYWVLEDGNWSNQKSNNTQINGSLPFQFASLLIHLFIHVFIRL